MKFNKQQETVINSIDGNIVVIASAGSGKSTTLTYRIKNMIDNGYCPSSILAITFSRKSKEDIIQKLNKINVTGVNVETFHSFALKIITANYNYTSKRTFKVWTTQWEKEKVINDICINKLNLSVNDKVPYNDIMSFITLQKTNMLTPNDKLILNGDAPFEKENMKRIYQLYEDFKRSKSYIEFDDFLNMANKILDHNQELLELYRNKYQYVLVDEFQDVSMSQSLLLKKINDKSTMIVGDPLQAIYSFRGGDSKYILNFDTDYDNVKVINLNTNYRCSNDIIITSNKLATYIPDSKHKNYVESVSANKSFKKPEFRRFFNEYEEAEWISKKIYELKEEGYNYDDIAILARTNAQLQKIETALHDTDIGFDVIDGKLFTDLPEIKLIISYLKLSVDQDDDDSFKYLYNKPSRWLDKKFLQETETNAEIRNVSLYKSMATIARRNWKFKNGIDEIYDVINHLNDKDFEDVSKKIKYLRERLNIDDFVTKGKQSDDGKYTEQIDNLDSFEGMCEKFKTTNEFIQYIDKLNEEIVNVDDKVKLLTIHKSKGMEYPVVFIVGCNQDLFPHYKGDNNDERRLMYVAITRAEKELYLSSSCIYNNTNMEISPFIEEIEDTIKIIKL